MKDYLISLDLIEFSSVKKLEQERTKVIRLIEQLYPDNQVEIESIRGGYRFRVLREEKETVPVGLVRDIVAALSDALENVRDEVDLKATSLDGALAEILQYHQDKSLAAWLVSEIQKIKRGKVIRGTHPF